MEIGQTVYLRPTKLGNAYRIDRDVKTSVITNIGRKYVYVERYGAFEITTGRQKTQYGADYVMYFDEEVLRLELEQEDLISRIRERMPTYGKWNIDVEKLRQIASILNC